MKTTQLQVKVIFFISYQKHENCTVTSQTYLVDKLKTTQLQVKLILLISYPQDEIYKVTSQTDLISSIPTKIKSTESQVKLIL